MKRIFFDQFSSWYRQHRRFALPVLILMAALFVFVFLIIFSVRVQPKPQSEKVWPVRAATVSVGEHHPVIVLYGVTESPLQSTLVAAVGAEIKKTWVREGDSVKKNQLLITLSERSIGMAIREREAEVDDLTSEVKREEIRYAADKKALLHEKDLVELSKRELVRLQTLVRTNHVSQSDADIQQQELNQRQLAYLSRERSVEEYQHRVDVLKARLKKAKAQLDRANLDLERTFIRAPFSGRIIKLLVSDGGRVREGDALIEILSDDELEVRATLPSKYIHTVRTLMKESRSVFAEAEEQGRPVKLYLKRLSPRVRQGQVGQELLFGISDETLQLPLNKTLSISLTLPAIANSIQLPITALYGNNKVYKIVQGRLQKVSVKRLADVLLPDKMHQVLVKSAGLNSGDKILMTPLSNAIDGLKVRIVSDERNAEK